LWGVSFDINRTGEISKTIVFMSSSVAIYTIEFAIAVRIKAIVSPKPGV
jgi:hypothetical protein